MLKEKRHKERQNNIKTKKSESCTFKTLFSLYLPMHFYFSESNSFIFKNSTFIFIACMKFLTRSFGKHFLKK